MEEETEYQLAVIRKNLQESGYFDSIEDAVKQYRVLNHKFQNLVNEFYRQEEEFRKVSRYLANKIEILTQENGRLYMENASLGHRHMEMLSRMASYEEKRFRKTICLPHMTKSRNSASNNSSD